MQGITKGNVKYYNNLAVDHRTNEEAAARDETNLPNEFF